MNAFDAFVCHALPLRGALSDIRFLLRLDGMGDHSSGDLDEAGLLRTDDAARRRLTGGVTLGLARRLRADLRLNYEKYFYDRPRAGQALRARQGGGGTDGAFPLNGRGRKQPGNLRGT